MSLSGRVPNVEVGREDRAAYYQKRHSKYIIFRCCVMSPFKRRSNGGITVISFGSYLCTSGHFRILTMFTSLYRCAHPFETKTCISLMRHENPGSCDSVPIALSQLFTVFLTTRSVQNVRDVHRQIRFCHRPANLAVADGQQPFVE